LAKLFPRSVSAGSGQNQGRIHGVGGEAAPFFTPAKIHRWRMFEF